MQGKVNKRIGELCLLGQVHVTFRTYRILKYTYVCVCMSKGVSVTLHVCTYVVCTAAIRSLYVILQFQ